MDAIGDELFGASGPIPVPTPVTNTANPVSAAVGGNDVTERLILQKPAEELMRRRVWAP
jgi:hypothetical protein